MAPLPASVLACEFGAAIIFGLILEGVKIPGLCPPCHLVTHTRIGVRQLLHSRYKYLEFTNSAALNLRFRRVGHPPAGKTSGRSRRATLIR